MKVLWGCLVAYILAAVMAFGYCYGDTYHDFDGYRYESDAMMARATTAFICGMIWPLYVSAQIGKHYHESK